MLSFLLSMQLSVFGLKNCNSAEKRKSRNKFISAFCRYNTIPVIMAMRTHLFPFRTQKLSSSTAKVLDHPRSGRIASCRISKKAQSQPSCGCVLFLQLAIRQGRTRATVNRTADTRCPWSPRWANAKRKAFAVPEAPWHYLNGAEKQVAGFQKRRNHNQVVVAFFFCNLLSDKGGRGRQLIGQRTPAVRGAWDKCAHM